MTTSKKSKDSVLTLKELTANRNKLIEFYNQELPLLRVQEEYYRLRASIQISQANEFNAMIQLAALKQGAVNTKSSKPTK